MKIRLLEEKDRLEVLNMMIGFYNSPAVVENVSEEVLSKNIDNCLSELPYITGFVFCKEEEIIGYAMIAKSYSTEFGGICIWIEDIFINSTFQGKGLAKEFFQFLEDTYKETTVRLRLEVANSNVNALKSYEKNGYRRLEYVQMSKEI